MAYQNSSVADAKIETGNYAISVHATAGSTAGATGWSNLGAGMVKSFAYVAESYTSQAGNAVDPIEGVAKETATIDVDLIEYDGSGLSILSGGIVSYSSATGITTITVGGQTNTQTARGIKLVNTRTLANGSVQTTTYVLNKCFMDGGYTVAIKSDNDTDPVAVSTFKILAKRYATAQVVFTKVVS